MSGGVYDHVGVRLSSEINEKLIEEALSAVKKGGKLDIVVANPPSDPFEFEELARKLYGFAPPRPQDLDFTVFFGRTSRENLWEKSLEYSDVVQDEDLSIDRFDIVAVGGTWDHFHCGHKLLLTLAAYSARSIVVVGVTSSKLLVNKKYAEALESYEKRSQSVIDFVHLLKPKLKVDIHPLDNMYGPTITVDGIGALVVSAETSKGGAQVNEKRNEIGWPSIDIVEAGLIPGHGENKLSSTDLRREELEKITKSKA